MPIIRKKCWPEHFKLVASGKKKLDLRLADFEVKEGDILILEEWNPKTGQYTGRKIEKKIDFVLKFDLNDFDQKEEIEKRGLYVLQF